jgi:hypothetical protein
MDAVESVPELLVEDEFICVGIGPGTWLQIGMLLLTVLDDDVFRCGAHVTVVTNEPGINKPVELISDSGTQLILRHLLARLEVEQLDVHLEGHRCFERLAAVLTNVVAG